MGPTLRFDVIEANYFGATLADEYGFDVLDFHFQFRFSLQHRMQDGVHWNAVAHRQITCLLLEHVAQAWGVELPDPGEKCRLSWLSLVSCSRIKVQNTVSFYNFEKVVGFGWVLEFFFFFFASLSVPSKQSSHNHIFV